jgi:hypothetical protein
MPRGRCSRPGCRRPRPAGARAAWTGARWSTPSAPGGAAAWPGGCAGTGSASRRSCVSGCAGAGARARGPGGHAQRRHRGYGEPKGEDQRQRGPPHAAGGAGGKKVNGRTRHRLVATTDLVHRANGPGWPPLAPRWPRRPARARSAGGSGPGPAASEAAVGRYGLPRRLQGLGGADARRDRRGRAAAAPRGLGATGWRTAGGATGVPGAAAALGRRAHAGLERARAPHAPGLRVPADHRGVRHLRQHDPRHAASARNKRRLICSQTPSRATNAPR